MRYIVPLLAVLAALFLGFASASATEAKVFHHYTQTDNGDACLTPEEVHDTVKDPSIENVVTVVDATEITTLRSNLVGYYQIPDTELIKFDRVEIYSNSAAPGMFAFVIYNEGCYVVDGKMTQQEFDAWLKGISVPGKEAFLKLGRKGFDPGLKMAADTTVGFA